MPLLGSILGMHPSPTALRSNVIEDGKERRHYLAQSFPFFFSFPLYSNLLFETSKETKKKKERKREKERNCVHMYGFQLPVLIQLTFTCIVEN